MNICKKENATAQIWDKVWKDKGLKSYSALRLHKTKDKIATLSSMGIDFTYKKVLDIGCGDGSALIYLKDKYDIKGIGIDISEEVIKKNRFSNIAGLKFLVGDHKLLKLPNNEFDIVLSWGVVEHLQEYIQALAEVKRVLKKDGILILIQPNSWSFGVLQEKILRVRGKWRFGNQKDFSYKYLKEILIALGYYDIAIKTKAPYKDMAITRIFDLFFQKAIKYWGHYLYVVAKKREMDVDYQESFELFLSHTDEKQVIKDLLHEKVDMNSVESCLDIGGGNGLLACNLGEKEKILVVEPNKNFVDSLRNNGFRCICSKWENVFLEERFDLILAAYVTTYFSKNQLKQLIEKMVLHLNNKGKLIILSVDETEGL